MKNELRSWFGQSIADKLVTGALAMLAPLAIWVSTRVSSAMLQEVLLFTAISGALCLLLIVYLNRRLARMEARQQRGDNLHALTGYIVRHRISEAPRTVLDRRVHFPNPVDLERAVLATIVAHRSEVRKWVNDDNPELSPKEIDDLLDVFYGPEPTASGVI